MYANVTCYASLNDRRRAGGVAISEQARAWLARFSNENKLARVVTIGDASWTSAIDGHAVDITRTGISIENLIEPLTTNWASARDAFCRGSESYLLAGLDLLQHIDREHIGAALAALWALTDRFLLVSFSTSPDMSEDAPQGTLLPFKTWTAIFEAAGFRKHALLEDNVRRVPQPSNELSSQWSAADPFGDTSRAAPYFVILEKIAGAGSRACQSAIDRLTDVAFKAQKRAVFDLPAGQVINFCLHQCQDWGILRPILDVVPRQRARVLIRPAFMRGDYLQAIRRFLARTGVACIEFHDSGELPWNELGGQIFLAGAESTLGRAHLFAFELMATARLHGCRTYKLQHGIWPRAYPRRIITSASEHVLVWGGEEGRSLNENRHGIFDASVPWGSLPGTQVRYTGTAKFADQIEGPFRDLAFAFGHDAADFDQTVLVGMKDLRKRWAIDNIDARFLDQLEKIIDAHPRALFVLRSHPLDDLRAFTRFKRKNVVISNDLIGIEMDLPLNRILPSVDLVASSASTLVLDAAISGLPVFVYGTGKTVDFEGLVEEPFENCASWLQAGADLTALRQQSLGFRSRYADAEDGSFYGRFHDLIAQDRPAAKIDREWATAFSLASAAVAAIQEKVTIEKELETVNRELAGLRNNGFAALSGDENSKTSAQGSTHRGGV